MKLLHFLLGDRITNAVVDEWKKGDKIVAGYVVVACFSVGVGGIISILKVFL
jgi:hypothetical protein